MKFKSISIGGKKISVEVTGKASSNDEDKLEDDKISSAYAPHEKFRVSFADLRPVFCSIYEVPAKWMEGMTVIGLTVDEHEDEERTAIIKVSRTFEKMGTKLKTIKTPAFTFDGSDKLHCSVKHADLLKEAIASALRYYSGERLDSLLSGKTPTETDDNDEGQDNLPGT